MTSKYAKKVLKIIKELYPTGCSQEVSVGKLVKNIVLSKDALLKIARWNVNITRLRLDFYIKDQVAIEVQGEQHVEPIRFANSIIDPEEDLVRRKALDEIKQQCLNEAGIPLVCIWYDEIDELTKEVLNDKILQAISKAEARPRKIKVKDKPVKKNKLIEDPIKKKARLAKAREIRRQRYKQLKERRKKYAK
jgi:DNA-binding protein YbaB